MSNGTICCGVDYGTKRIGLAIGNPDGTIASPLTVVEATGAQNAVIERILRAVSEYDVGAWVVGLPLNMDGTEGEQAKLTRRFGDALARATGAPVHYWDERLSSNSADEHLASVGLTHKKKKARRDAVAAQVILQSYLDAKP